MDVKGTSCRCATLSRAALTRASRPVFAKDVLRPLSFLGCEVEVK